MGQIVGIVAGNVPGIVTGIIANFGLRVNNDECHLFLVDTNISNKEGGTNTHHRGHSQ